MINRNNYEEYLLLYIDGELSSEDRLAVEAFLAANPDIQQELEVLQQAVLQPEENIAFEFKHQLYRKAAGIDTTNYQEYFLLYVDNELNPAEQQAVETFVLQHPELQDEFTVLKQAVLPAETIVFENKELLYRKEEKRRPIIISMRWAALAAAVIIGVIALVGVFNTGDTPANGNNGYAANGKGNADNSNGSNTNTADDNTGNTNATGVPAPGNNVNTAKSLMASTTGSNKTNGTVANTGKRNTVPAAQAPANQQLAVTEEQQTVTPSYTAPAITNPVAVAPVTTPNVTNAVPDNNPVTKPSAATSDVASNNNTTVQNASYTEELDADDNKHKNLYVGALQINSSKVRGFFRKAGRILSSKTRNKDGDKVQVANVEVNKL